MNTSSHTHTNDAPVFVFAGKLTANDYIGRHKDALEKLKEPDWQELLENGAHTCVKVNRLLEAMRNDGVITEYDPNKGDTCITSGWRPPEYNSRIPNAAPRSKHITGQACDLYDPEGALDEWCMCHLGVLEEIGLWLEHPSATKGWCHVQTVPPRSGNRVFYP